MATTLDEITKYFDASEIKYRAEPARNRIIFGFATEKYRSPKGEAGVMLGIELNENGEYLRVVAPHAFVAKGPHVAVFFKACLIYQWRTKLIQFEFDDQDGEIRPVIEFPLEDAKLTAKQLERCIGGIVELLEDGYEPLNKALTEGVLDFPGPKAPPGSAELMAIMSALAGASEEDRARLIDKLREIAGQGKRDGGSGGPPESI
jgi:hypothetical protein